MSCTIEPFILCMLALIAHVPLTYCHSKPSMHGLPLVNMFLYVIKFWTNYYLTTHNSSAYITPHPINLTSFPIHNIGPRILALHIIRFFFRDLLVVASRLELTKVVTSMAFLLLALSFLFTLSCPFLLAFGLKFSRPMTSMGSTLPTTRPWESKGLIITF